ncbi:MAG: hypothetical protein ABI233_08220 [Chthoniobacterales bacterium]
MKKFRKSTVRFRLSSGASPEQKSTQFGVDHIAISRIWFAILKTTLNIDDTVMARLRRESARQNRTMSELVESALRLLFQSAKQQRKKKLPPLPTFRSGGHLVDIADRDALYDVMEGRR